MFCHAPPVRRTFTVRSNYLHKSIYYETNQLINAIIRPQTDRLHMLDILCKRNRLPVFCHRRLFAFPMLCPPPKGNKPFFNESRVCSYYLSLPYPAAVFAGWTKA